MDEQNYITGLDTSVSLDSELFHHGVKNQKWGERRYQNKDGTLTPLGRIHYGIGNAKKRSEERKAYRLEKKAKKQAEKLEKLKVKKELKAAKQEMKDTKKWPKRKTDMKYMTDDEIKNEINRLALERDLKDMRESAKMSKGKEAFKNAIKDAATRSVANAIETLSGAAVSKIADNIAINNRDRLAEREAELQLEYLNENGQRDKAGSMLEDYYSLLGKHPKNAKGGKNGSEVRQAREDAEDELRLRVLNGDQEAAQQLRDYMRANNTKNNNNDNDGSNNNNGNNNNGNNGNNGNNNGNGDQPKTDQNDKATQKQQEREAKRAERQKENERKQAEKQQQREAKKQEKERERQERIAKQQAKQEQTTRERQEREARKQAEREAKRAKAAMEKASNIVKQNTQKQLSQVKAAQEQQQRAKEASRQWAKHKYDKRIANPDGTYTYVYDDAYREWISKRLS